MDSQTSLAVIACVLLVVVSVASLVGITMFTRATVPLPPQKDPQLLAYLAARGYASQPSYDPSPPSLAGRYPGIVFGTCGEIAFALTVSTIHNKTTTAIYASRPHGHVGTWWCAPRGQLRSFVTAPLLNTHDATFDAQVETFGKGPDGPSTDMRARILAFPGGVQAAGWLEGRAMVTMTTRKDHDPIRLDAAFDLLRALTSTRSTAT